MKNMKKNLAISILALGLLLPACSTNSGSSATTPSSTPGTSSNTPTSSEAPSSETPSSSEVSSSSEVPPSSSESSSETPSSSSTESSVVPSTASSSTESSATPISSSSYSPINPIVGEIVEFGRYPQECLNDPNDPSATLPEGINTATDIDDDGYIEFDGKDYLKTLGSGMETYYRDETTNELKVAYKENEIYYFEVAPIKWKVMSDGTLLSVDIIDASPFHPDRVATRTINNETIEANNYEYSHVRAYLNGYDGTSYGIDDFGGIGFLDKAFSEQERSEILTTTVDNSPATTHSVDDNPYASDNTEDKVFLLSYQDCLKEEYGFSTVFSEGETRVKTHTDYAIFKGLYYTLTTTNSGHWWVRSPSSGYTDQASCVHPDGILHTTGRVDPYLGLVPAVKVNL